MENNVDMELLELNEMREQMQMLKDSLDKQIQVNEGLMLQNLKKNSSIIKRHGTEVLIFALLAIYPIIIYSRMYGLTRVLTIVSIIVLLVDGLYNYWVTHLVKDEDLSNNDISNVLKKMLKVKRITRAGITVDIIVAIVMVLWIVYETIFGPRFPLFSRAVQKTVIVGLIIGILLGVIIAIYIYRRQAKAINEIVDILDGRLR